MAKHQVNHRQMCWKYLINSCHYLPDLWTLHLTWRACHSIHFNIFTPVFQPNATTKVWEEYNLQPALIHWINKLQNSGKHLEWYRLEWLLHCWKNLFLVFLKGNLCNSFSPAICELVRDGWESPTWMLVNRSLARLNTLVWPCLTQSLITPGKLLSLTLHSC